MTSNQTAFVRPGKDRWISGAILLLITFSIIILISINGLGADTPVCGYCGKEITGRYIQAGGKFFHPDHFRCALCQKNIGSGKFFNHDGKIICENCYYQNYALRCRQCGRPITGEYIEQDGFFYHKDCYEEHIALKCALCGKIITGNYLIDYWGNNYCQSHEKENPRCEYCGRFIGEDLTLGGETYPDGRQVCGICARSAVSSTIRADRLMKDAIARLAAKGITVKTGEMELHLVDKNKLQSVSLEISDRHTGFVKYEASKSWLGSRKEKFDIYILDGMPEYDYISAVSHELMHVWLFQQRETGHDEALAEGSCNYASYLVLGQLSGDYPKYLIHNLFQDTHPHYGEGFRRVHKLVERQGLNGWLELLRNSSNFPPGH